MNRKFATLLNNIRFWQYTSAFLFVILLVAGAFYYLRHRQQTDAFSVHSTLGGNIFPSAIYSTATTGTRVIDGFSSHELGNPANEFGIRITAPHRMTKVHIEVGETPFWDRSVSDFVLPEKNVEYTLYPDVLWRFEALRLNNQAEPVTVPIEVTIGRDKPVLKNATFSVRSINECLLGYRDDKMNFHETSIFFAAYVNEEHPMLDQLLREALNTRIVKRFVGLQQGESQVDKQVYALWYMLQKRNFSYSSISNTSLSSNVVYSQRVRTLDDALDSSQINCVDGSVLMASLLRAINIEPVLIRIPGHMFVGYYSDKQQENLHLLETTMLGDVRLDDYFPDENLDSISEGKSQSEMSKLTFEKAKEYASRKYAEHETNIEEDLPNYMFLKISKETRAKVQSIGR
ncbi:MAG: hypothetical protein MJZ73_06435 [Bacteroidaceae bacterium]|nr:hypothetical protein [Bacteroidaceae bacterium]